MADKLNVHKIQRYGWVPDLPDARDHVYSAPLMSIGPLPDHVDLSSKCPPVYDQGQLGSCTANAIGAAIQFDRMKQNLTPDFVPSRLFIYYNERVIEHSVPQDNGAQIRDGIKSVATLGVCPEDEWPYDIGKFADEPPPQVFSDAARTKAAAYCRVGRSLSQMRGCLASGFPFVLGFSVYDSFEGEAVMAVGYSDKDQRFLIRNSWSAQWGQKGYFTMPYAYLMDGNLSDDFWTVRLIAGQ